LQPCLNKTYGKPTPLKKAEIKELVGRYVWAAEVLAKAGADGVIVSSYPLLSHLDIGSYLNSARQLARC
jgi:2,4-dienoyl-CoA reductase-like NADH-dependent reductase (Old Yellow Enzyme family)